MLLWQPPSEPNGNITGYQVHITYTDPETGEGIAGPILELPSNVFVYDLRTLDIPPNVTAEVRVSQYMFEPSYTFIVFPMYSFIYICIVVSLKRACELGGTIFKTKTCF